MKIIKAMITAVVVVSATLTAKASEININFDGKTPHSLGGRVMRSVSFSEKTGDIDEPKAPEPVLLNDAPVNLNYSILKTISYSEQKGIDQSVVLNLKKLLILGTKDEKIEFMKSSKYVFPRRFAEFESVRFGNEIKLLRNRGYETHCWEDNCRMEQVCGYKKSCSRGCQLLGVTCAAAGAATTQYYTGGFFPSASAAVGGAVGLGCKWGCEDWVCDDIEDCREVKKCDSHCETVPVSGGADHVDPNTGQVLNS